MDERRACRVAIYRLGSIEDDPQTLEEVRGWMIERLLRFREVFAQRLVDLLDGSQG